MLVFVVDYSSNPVTPTNWTSLPAGTTWIPYNIFAYYKFWHAGDPTSYTFGIVNYPKAVMRVYRGVSSIDAVSPAPSMYRRLHQRYLIFTAGAVSYCRSFGILRCILRR